MVWCIVGVFAAVIGVLVWHIISDYSDRHDVEKRITSLWYALEDVKRLSYENRRLQGKLSKDD